jgi:hypothetical protein
MVVFSSVANESSRLFSFTKNSQLPAAPSLSGRSVRRALGVLCVAKDEMEGIARRDVAGQAVAPVVHLRTSRLVLRACNRVA